MSSSTSSLTLFCDGASRGNPGPGAFGYVILAGEELVFECGETLGTVTNNIAEYQGVLQGLKKCRELGAKGVVVKSDSQLLVRQLNGLYKIRAPHLIPLFDEARALLDQFDSYEVVHIPREENKKADALANKALDRMRAG